MNLRIFPLLCRFVEPKKLNCCKELIQFINYGIRTHKSPDIIRSWPSHYSLNVERTTFWVFSIRRSLCLPFWINVWNWYTTRCAEILANNSNKKKINFGILNRQKTISMKAIFRCFRRDCLLSTDKSFVNVCRPLPKIRHN